MAMRLSSRNRIKEAYNYKCSYELLFVIPESKKSEAPKKHEWNRTPLKRHLKRENGENFL